MELAVHCSRIGVLCRGERRDREDRCATGAEHPCPELALPNRRGGTRDGHFNRSEISLHFHSAEIEPWKDMGYWAGSLAGRHLLDSSTPACEANILYNVVELSDPMNFSAVVTISNSREVVMSHWQLVWTYDSYQNIIMSGAEGAIALTGGSPGGAPVRLVDSFTTNGIAASKSHHHYGR